MRLAKVLMAAAAMTMTAAPAVAASRAATALSKAPEVRTATKAGKSKAVGGAGLIALLAVIPLGFAIYTAVDGEPDSD